MSLMKDISSVKFRSATGIKTMPYVHLEPKQLETRHLVMKVRYHMKQVLACLMELNEREPDVCKLLSKSLFQYKVCLIQHDENSLRMFIKIKGKK